MQERERDTESDHDPNKNRGVGKAVLLKRDVHRWPSHVLGQRLSHCAGALWQNVVDTGIATLISCVIFFFRTCHAPRPFSFSRAVSSGGDHVAHGNDSSLALKVSEEAVGAAAALAWVARLLSLCSRTIA